MHTGQVGLIRTTGLIPWLIQRITRSPYNHVIVAVNARTCVSGEPGGARLRPIANWDDIVWSHFDLTPQQRLAITSSARSMLGTPYNWSDFYAAGIAALLKGWTPRFIRARAASHESLICSQVADIALQAGNINVFSDGRPAGAVTPASFGRYYDAQGWTAP